MTSRRLGHYELRGELGRGGMGVVYRAFDHRLEREVALKTISGLADQEAVERFVREARAAGRLRHPGIVAVYEAGVLDGTCYAALELVAGGSLSKRLQDRGPLAPHEAAVLVRDLARAVQVAHEAGVIHRDLKPANVLLDGSGRPRLTDFGLARDEGATQITETGVALGTPAYMAPEQAAADSAQIGPTTDVYGLGAVLYHALTGSAPYQGGTGLAVLHRVIHEDVENPSRRRARVKLPALGRDIETICLKALEKRPRDRYASAAALADDLGRYASGEAILARPASFGERLGRWLRRNRAAAIASVLVVAAIVGLAVVDRIVAQRAARAARRAAAEKAVAEAKKALDDAEDVFYRAVENPSDADNYLYRETVVDTALHALACATEYAALEGESARLRAHRLAVKAMRAAIVARSEGLARAAAKLDGSEGVAALSSVVDAIGRNRRVAHLCDQAREARLHGYDQRAWDFLAQALAVDAESINVRMLTAILAVDRGDRAAALAQLDFVVGRAPTWASPWQLRGQVHAQLGDFDAAERDWGRALALDPKDTVTLCARGRARFRRGAIADAQADLLAASTLEPLLPDPMIGLSEVYTRLGHPAEAVACLERAAVLAPRVALTQLLLGDAYRDAHRVDDAVRAYRECLRLGPSDEVARSAVARLKELGPR